MRPGWALLIAALALGGCDRSADEERTRQPPARPTTLIGSWTTDQPATFSGEGLRTRMSDGRTVYKPQNRFEYSGRLTIFGPQIPPAGLSFEVTAAGDWRRSGNRLVEDFTQVRLRSERDDPVLDDLADQLAVEMRDQPPSESRILSLSDNRLELRDAASGRTSSYTRAR